MKPIVLSSRQHPLCKLIRALDQPRQRRQRGLFIAPGRRAIAVALAVGWPLEQIVVAADERSEHWIDEAHGAKVPVAFVERGLLAYLSDVPSAPEAIALAKLPVADDSAPLPDGLSIVLDRIGDAGNVGTLIRSADAAGASAVVATEQSADAFSLKAVRASAGSIFHLPPRLFSQREPANLIARFAHEKIPIVVAAAHGATDGLEFDWPRRAALVLGHESQGLAPEWLSAATAHVTIPIYGRAESLNVATAGALLMYAWRRRWR
ncbi:MAG: RNA methyltransferase [Planctomycetes bacterium]|nr:RNA methyltransferase [Planctomycetota bacterium]